MEKLTKEEYEYLQKFEKQINTATKSDYMRGIQKADVEKIGNIYSRLIGHNYVFNSGCSRCILKLIKSISSYYYECKSEEDRREEASRKTTQIEGDRDSYRQGEEDKGDPKEVSKRPRTKGNRRVS